MCRTEQRSSARLLAKFRLTRTVALQWLVVSVVGFFAFAYGFASLYAALQGQPLEVIVVPASLPTEILQQLTVGIVLLAIVVALHEFLHGVFMARYGSDPSYGFGVSYFVLPYAYAEVERASYTRTQMLAVLLAPFVGITSLGLLALLLDPSGIPSSVLLVALAANGAGSIGDLWMAAVLLQYPSDVRVDALPETDVQGFGIYGAGDRSIERLPGTAFLSRVGTGAVATLSLLGAAVIALVLVSLAVGSGTVELGDPNGRWFLFRHEVGSGGSAHLEIGDALVLGLAIGGGFVRAIFGTLYERTGRE